MDESSRHLIVIRNLRLWAHVGVFEYERENGQWFELDLEVRTDVHQTAADDAVNPCSDYGMMILCLFKISREFRCNTLESWSDYIYDVFQSEFKPAYLQLQITKLRPPVAGFLGEVKLKRVYGE